MPTWIILLLALEAKGEIAQVIRQLQQGPQTAQAAQQATAGLDGLTDRHLQAKSTPKPPPGFNPQIGDRIRIPKIGQKAEVISKVDENGNQCQIWDDENECRPS